MYGPEDDEPDELGDIVEEQDAYVGPNRTDLAQKARPAMLFAWCWWVTPMPEKPPSSTSLPERTNMWEITAA